MTKEARDKLSDLLKTGPKPALPDGLTDRIKKDIPDPLPRPGVRDARWDRLQVLKAAAMVLVIVGGVWAGFRLERRLTRPKAPVSLESRVRPIPRSTTDPSVFPGPVAKAAYISPEVQPMFQFPPDVQSYSPEKARPYLDQGVLPPYETVPPDLWVGIGEDEGFPSSRLERAVTLEGCPSPLTSDPRVKLLRVEVASPERDFMVRKPLDLTVVVDLKGMGRDAAELLELKEAVQEAMRDLKIDDHLGLSLEEGNARFIVKPTADRDYVFRVLDGLKDHGIPMPPAPPAPPAPPTPLHDRVQAVIRLAPYTPEAEGCEAVRVVERGGPGGVRVRTIILGGRAPDRAAEFHVEKELLKEKARELQDKGRELEVVQETLRVKERELLLQAKEEAKAAGELKRRLRETLQGMVLNENVTVEFDPRTVDGYRLLGQSVVPAVVREDGRLREGRKIMALYEVRLKGTHAADAPVARVVLRSQDEGGNPSALELARAIREEDFARDCDSASEQLKKAALMARFTQAAQGVKVPDQRELECILEETRRLAKAHARQGDRFKEFQRWVEVAAKGPVLPPVPPVPPLPPEPPQIDD